MITVLIADDDRPFVELLSNKISENSEFEIVAKVYNSKNTIDQIMRLRPDILLLDIAMPGSDGVYIVNYIRSQMRDYNPFVYLLSGIGTSSIIKTNGLDIDFFSLKPIEPDIVLTNLNRVMSKCIATPKYRHSTSPEMSSLIEGLSTQLGISPHRKSTQCMNYALIYCIENPNGTHLITKILYPKIAKRLGMSSSTVERNIRYAISSIHKARTSMYLRMFAYADGKKITNSEFLAVVSEYVTMNHTMH